MTDGVQDTLCDSAGALQSAYSEKYETFLDVEGGTGRSVRAYNRLMASYALSPSTSNSSFAMSDVLYPTLPTEAVIPIYWGEEGSTISDSRVGVVLVVVIAFFVCRRRHAIKA